MSPPRRPQGPRSSNPTGGPGTGKPSRPRAFDSKRGWKGGEPPAGPGERAPGKPPVAPRQARPGPRTDSARHEAARFESGPPRRDPASPPRGRPEAPRLERREEDRPPANTLWLHGLHAVAAALVNPRRRLRRLLVTADAEAALKERLPEGTFAARKIQPERVEDRARFHTFLPEDSVHQGVALLAEPLPGIGLDDALKASDGPVLLLDQVTDPRNVGAILRSAAAFGAAAVVVQDRHAPPETGALARAASGALELVPMVREVNLARAIRHLQDGGAWVLGLAGDAGRTLAEAKPTDRRVGLVLGAEGGGLRRLQRETCDELVRLPITDAMESLNVASAAAVALYELRRA
ncbi:23S rRNA (guanosine(2251)-2'-O)-methyltransferase RlmB [Pararoseomonas indoligenes]|uniref:23S rRNA (Guanosine(2251)-2'-O)-methyltransferase RlmB n=1 Tax=Roseomonas indoligenes TaxID=2820811 RepID=A0A940MYB0_9PROT|nr:RNA methyltransferase [Pararoseomonas indoligenes]MBP0494346.1 23S rRNA (guanosine(2251)-2'-O)-methyltransferase RlmB [Pararoseomonas indoligenes]